MKQTELIRTIVREAKRYCGSLLLEGSKTWNVPEEFLDSDNPEWAEARWRAEIAHIGDKLKRHAEGRRKNNSY